ncbi:spore gernimation protein [Bacillus pseudomycoides]|nr:spore gernimation protein [Bacillus pseudomycoides]
MIILGCLLVWIETEKFSEKYTERINAIIYIKQLLEHNMETGSLLHDNLHWSSFYYYKQGQDAFTPIVNTPP